MPKSQIILMGDVIGNSELDGNIVQRALAQQVDAANSAFKSGILSPLTITLGDEFQGVIADLSTAVEILFAFEEDRIANDVPFEMRYVTHLGEIETPIDSERAHGMLGEGLTQARTLLSEKKQGTPRFHFSTPSAPASPVELSMSGRLQEAPPHKEKRNDESWQRFQFRQLAGIFLNVDRLVSHWKPKDYALIASMIEHPDDDKAVGEIYGKNRSQIWKRRRTLRIDDYVTLKNLATEIAAVNAP